MEFNIEDLRAMPTEVIKEKLDKQSEGLDYLDKLCSELKVQLEEQKNINKKLNLENQKLFEENINLETERKDSIIEWTKTSKQLAIEELEKVYAKYYESGDDILGFIDQRINELRGRK